TIERGGQTVATVSKRWLSLRDTYAVDIAPDQDDLVILTSVLALDLAEDRERRQRKQGWPSRDACVTFAWRSLGARLALGWRRGRVRARSLGPRGALHHGLRDLLQARPHVVGGHHRGHRDLRLERLEQRLGDARHLRRFLHVENDERGPHPVV